MGILRKRLKIMEIRAIIHTKRDSKSLGAQAPCRFESGFRHSVSPDFLLMNNVLALFSF